MSKTILICGLPGTGKTTIARRLAKELQARYVSDFEIISDKERQALGYDRERVSEKFSARVDEFVTNTSGFSVIDLDYSVFPKDYYEFKSSDSQIFYLGYADVSLQRLEQAFAQSDAMTAKSAEYFLSISNFCREECKKYGFKFFEVSENRSADIEANLAAILSEIKN